MDDREKLTDQLWKAWAYAEEVCASTPCAGCPAIPKGPRCMTRLAADHLIDHGVTFATDNNVGGKWIPVTEQLPELGKNVLMYFKDCETIVSGFLNGGEPGRATWWSSFTDGDWYTDCDSSPDYWMPAPELPADMRKGENHDHK